jgi:hypothetical protein
MEHTQLGTVIRASPYLQKPAPKSQSQNDVMTDRQSVSVSWCQASSGSHDQMFVTVWRLLWVFVGHPLWWEVGSVVCQSHVHTLYTNHLSVRAKYSKLCPTNSSSRCHGSLDTWTVVHMIAVKLKPLIYSMRGFALSHIVNILIFMILNDFCLSSA